MKNYKKFYRNFFFITFLTLIISSCAGKRIHPPILKDSLTESIDKAIARVKPALIRIRVVSTEYFDGREIRQESSGSGVIIRKDGYAVTNHHVAGKAIRIICTLSNKEEIEAKLIGTDPLTDIAVIKLDNDGNKNFPIAEFGDPSSIKVGDYVLAMGSPLALSQSVTLGIISNTEMVMPQLFWPFNKFTLDGEDIGTIIRWIGHDAAIYGGNSGGPLVNLKGEIIGINEIGLGLSGAIPGNIAKESAENLITKGAVERSWIGLEIQPLLKSSLIKKGVLVSGVIKGSPAEKAGFKAGDTILEIAGKEITITNTEELPLLNQLVVKLPLNEKSEFLILRDGEKKILTLETIRRENFQPQVFEFKEWGMTACNISLLMAKELKRKSEDGVLIKNIRPGGPCGEAKPSIRSKDIITAVGDKPVKNIDDLSKITQDIIKEQTKPVPILVSFERGENQYITVVNVGIKELDDPGLEAKKAWLPINFQVVTKDIAKAIGIEKLSGVRITQVYTYNSPEKLNLKRGDIITAVDGQPIKIDQPEDIETFRALIRQYKIGSKIKLTILSDKEQKEIEVELPASPKSEREMKKYRDENFNLIARDITFFDQMEKDGESVPSEEKGVIITSVEPGGWAALGHLAVDDMLISVNNKAVSNIDILEKTMKEIAEQKSKYVVLQILRGIHHHFIELEPDWEKK